MKRYDIYRILTIAFYIIFSIIVITAIATIYLLNTDNFVINKLNKMIKPKTVAYASPLNNNILACETENIYIDEITKSTEKETEVVEYTEKETEFVEVIEPKRAHSYSEYEMYELAKIIMCEAEGESQKCKEYIGQVIINRTKSDDFPDTIHDVIFERNQFTPTFDGRWERVEPDEDSYNAAYAVVTAEEPFTEALWFEACGGSSWHSRNLTQVTEIGNTRFYIE